MPELNYHIACPAGSVGGYCILPGDPGRVESIAALLDNAEKVDGPPIPVEQTVTFSPLSVPV